MTTMLERTLGDLVRERPARSAVLEKRRLDYCCGGKLSLAEACRKANLDPAEVGQELKLADELALSPGAPEESNLGEMTLSSLCDRIEAMHHAYLREALPRIAALSEKVARAHGERNPNLKRLTGVFTAMRAELEAHMMKEERILFPAIRQIEAAGGANSPFSGNLGSPVAVMEHEHENAGRALEEMRALLDDYSPPEWACGTYLAMNDAFRALELDMRQHVHAENNILFPRALELERAGERRVSG